jgi:hypothetical protein
MEQVRFAVVQVEETVPPVLAEYAVAVYPVIAAPPVLEGASHATVAAVCPAVTTTC